MLWLRLLVYALTGQRLWVCDEPKSYWFGRVVEAWPDHILLDVAAQSGRTETSRIVIPLASIVYVREDFPEGWRLLFEQAYEDEAPGDEPDDTATVTA